MAISLKDLRRGKSELPTRTLLYGPPGLGKTTLAAEWPNPVFIQTEDGFPIDMENPPPRFSREDLGNFDGIMEAMYSLYNDPHDFGSVAFDSLDKMEPLVWAKTCEVNNWANIEAPGYGKGYLAAEAHWRELIEGANALRRDRGMHIVFIAHSSIETVNDPMTVAYSRYDIRLQKRAVALFQDEVDAIFFLNQDVTIKVDDPKAKQGPGTRSRADGGGNRWIYTTPRPSFVSKNRYGISDKILYERGKGFAALSANFPNVQTTAPVEKAA
jgi:hypothetical protein